jgi:hypothetical protein
MTDFATLDLALTIRCTVATLAPDQHARAAVAQRRAWHRQALVPGHFGVATGPATNSGAASRSSSTITTTSPTSRDQKLTGCSFRTTMPAQS